jgi:hypothetical protein
MPRESQNIDQSEFTSVFSARPQNFAWFLGAGASATAGLPTATDVIWDLKRRFYRREENQDISRQDMQNEPVRARIQAFMESRGFPELWAADEYTAYFEKIFGDDKERQRRYLKAILSEEHVTLSVGILLGSHRRSQASGPGSQVPRSAFLAGPERSLCGVFYRCSQTSLGRNRDPAGAT